MCYKDDDEHFLMEELPRLQSDIWYYLDYYFYCTCKYYYADTFPYEIEHLESDSGWQRI